MKPKSAPDVTEQPEARPVVACSALLACPWGCKGDVIYENYGTVGWHIECPECGSRGPWGEDKRDARQQWNKLKRQANG